MARTKNIYDFIENYIRRNEEITENFVDNVDLKSFPDYAYVIPFEINLKKILSRLENNYYRTEQVRISISFLKMVSKALKHDLLTIKGNAFTFNDPKALVCSQVSQIVEETIAWLEGRVPLSLNSSGNSMLGSSRTRRMDKKTKVNYNEEQKENFYEHNEEVNGFSEDHMRKNDNKSSGRLTRSKRILSKN